MLGEHIGGPQAEDEGAGAEVLRARGVRGRRAAEPAQGGAASVAPTQEDHPTPGPRQGLSSLLERNQPPGHSRGALQAKDVSALINELAV